MKNLIIITLALLVHIIPAQEIVDGKIKFPPWGIGPSLGYETGEVDGKTYHAGTVGMRLGYVIQDFYPIIFLGSEVELSQGELSDYDEESASGTGYLIAGGVIPFYLLTDKIPIGAGLPLYFGYGYHHTQLENQDISFQGQRFKIGSLLPIPLSFIKAGLLIEREWHFNENSNESQNWKFKVQFPISL